MLVTIKIGATEIRNTYSSNSKFLIPNFEFWILNLLYLPGLTRVKQVIYALNL